MANSPFLVQDVMFCAILPRVDVDLLALEDWLSFANTAEA